MKRQFVFLATVAATLGLMSPSLVYAEDYPMFILQIKEHHFEPATIELPAHKNIKLIIKNLDATAEEFNSDDLHREKVIPAEREGVVYIGPLDPGTYKFTGEFNPSTAVGSVIVK